MKAGVHAPTYRSWQMMKNRCLNPSAVDFSYYGGRGITVPDEWLAYEGFLASMGERPVGMTLDRERGNEGYSRSNCRWATRKEQSQNREGYTLDVSFAGRTQKTWQWAAELGLTLRGFHSRLYLFKVGKLTEARIFRTRTQGVRV